MQDRTAALADHVLGAIQTRLLEFGIEVERDDEIVTLSHGSARAEYAVEVKEPMTLSSLAHRGSSTPSYPLLIAGRHISRRSAAAFREAGVQFVDTLGNAFITFGPVHIEVQGRTGPTDGPTTVSTSGRPSNLFSSGRSQVILALLTWPELVGGKVREIAKAAGISVGQAHDALGRLADTGYLAPPSNRLTRADELLDYWTAAYPAGLGRRLDLAHYHGDPTKPVTSEAPTYLSGESAVGVDIRRPATLTVYVDSADPRLAILNRWSTSPDRKPNVFVRQKFWTSPRPDEDQKNAPWPLVYADLAATADPRLAEVAKTWRVRRARPGQV
ncbi:hypothetical protein BJ973_006199 [Actinoplanes tereljensis]|uniref:HTH iclR-type domain-containing protein n=1 Tax=Paractinoplanes tereljensis TaxID=571912 RepID=A0A919NJH6_9ACTN|nr:type IV toxin-antitoxin system AbiEi family antitoxin [Actinoplanes tereljensis]GIF19151.1 hypothetical protein Ate02nite_18810 [Actinoplanes tereljensis]